MSADNPKMSELVDAIVEETQVDWDRVIETAKDDDERDLLQAVASLARIQAATDSDGTSQVEPVRWGPLDILGRVGQGSFGTVYRARDPVLNLDVALKILKPDVVAGPARILEEGRALARLRHPNIVRVYGADKRNDAIGLRMELLGGESLHAIVRRDGPLGSPEAARIGIDLCRALSAVHTAGLVHRDVKAQNVMREPDGRIVLMDLGASTSSVDEDPSNTIGTPYYMAPERLSGRPSGPASDLYALGVLLYYLVTGLYPVSGTDLAAVRNAHREGRIGRLQDADAGVPEVFARVVDRCLAPVPRDRFPDARSVARALASARIGEAFDAPADSTIRHNLPPRLTRFIGREADAARVAALLAGRRLVTLTGAGGGGKTRLALETAASMLESFPGGVFVVELAGVMEEAQVATTLATTLAVDVRGRDILEALIEHLAASDPLLLLLDNCEHVLPAARHTAKAILRAAPRVRLLATSREPLGTAGEATFHVAPLDVPPVELDPRRANAEDVTRALASPAIRLFVDGATAARHDFGVTPGNVTQVVDVCRRLDGLPLALELAGAAVRHLSVSDIATRLRESFDVLADADHASMPHHRTLDTCIAWSYDALDPVERRALDCLSVFSGGWTLDAAEVVLPRAASLEESRVLTILSGLVSKSLVQLHIDTESGGARYRMLDTIRSFAADRLSSGGESETARVAFLDFYIDLAERLGSELRRASQRAALVRLNAEMDNLHTALTNALDHGDVHRGRRLAGAMGTYWLTRSRHREGLRYCEALLDAEDGDDGDTLEKGRVAEWSGVFLKRIGEHDRGWSRAQESLAIRRKLGDRQGEAGSLNSLGITCYERGDYDRAMSFYDESLAIRRAIGDELGVAQVLNNKGIIHESRGEHDTALSLYEEALAIHRRIENDWGVAMVLNSIGVVRANRADYDGARDAFERALDIHTAMGDRWGVTIKHMNLGHVARWQKRFDEARRFFESAMAVQRDIGNRPGLMNSLLGLALVDADEGDLRSAAWHLGQVDAILAEHDLRLEADEERERDALIARLVDALGERALEQERRRGREAPTDPIGNG